ncbi:restriction endonuclease subunit S [Halobacterium salinarum]|uniref:restriction endonuclease subunit S n=1 Tax=Halobacterium salinarum TaxID=2242 RepID=UPI0025569520|nr:restriction endonuclease subunit S [Halobacterium salinarum]MDL0122818.1 restriction endonuclease subunit S [Halobacterium salinarum]MDL0141419.1 restriction endonuclease subunit S [Halobacterium salinarum]
MSEQDATLEEFVDENDPSDKGISVGELQQLETSPIEEWKLTKLGEILTLEYGDNLPSGSRNNGEIPVYGSNGQVDTHSEPTVDLPGIVMGRKGSIGEIEFSDTPFWPIDTTYYITEEETDQNLRFLYYLLQNIQLERLNAASAIPGLNRNDTYGLNSIIPPLEEQRKIASVLYNVEQAIQKTEEIIEQTQQIKTAVVQQAFTEGVFHHDEYVDTKSGRTPANWELVKFESMIEDTRYGTNSKSNTDGDGYPTLRIPNVVEKRVTLEDLKHTPLDDDELERLELEENDILVLRTNGNPDYVGRCATFSEQDEPFVFASYLIRVRVDESRVRPEYIKEFLNSRRGRSEMAGWIRSSAGNYNLSVGAMENFQVPIPSLEEQDAIVEKISAAEQAIETNRQYRDKLQRLKQGLMQDLLSGEVRTTDVDIPVLDAVAKHG